MTADGTITEWQLVKRNADEHVLVSAAAYEKVVGIAIVEAVSGQIVSVATDDVCIAIAGGTISMGDLLTSNGDGTVITATAGHTAYICGMALQDAASGDKFRVELGHSYMA